MTMRTRPTEYLHILWKEDKHLPCISGARLRVQDVVARHLAGSAVEDSVEAFPPHTPAEIYSALAYYHDHKDEMVELIEDHRRSAANILAEVEARQGPSKLRQLVKARDAHA